MTMLDPRPLRILLVHERFPPDFGGGGEYVVLQIAKHLMALGHQVKMLTTGNPADQVYEGVPLKRLPISRYRFNTVSGIVAQEAQDADLIHCFSYHAAIPAYRAARRMNKPVVLGVLALFGDAWLSMRGPWIGRLFQRFETYLMRLPFDRRLFLSPGSLGLAHSLGPVRAGDMVLPPGISLEDYHAAPVKNGVMFSGKIDSRKGVDMVLALARGLPDVPFVVMGWGEGLVSFRQSAPPNITVLPFLTRAGLAEALSTASIFLFPSKAETFGLVVAEAMASGCAVVGQAPLDFEGTRIDPSDVPACMAAEHALWTDPARCQACGEKNQVLAQQYSWSRHMKDLLAVYQSLVGNPRHTD